MKIKFYFANSTSLLKELGAEIIKLVEGTNYCHLAVGLETEYSEHIYEAVFPKSQKLTKNEWLKSYSVAYEFSIDIPNVHKFLEVKDFLESNIGKWYAFDQCVWIALIIWFKIKKTVTRKVKLNGSKNIVCTELGFLLCKQFLIGNFDENSDSIDLNEMFSIASSLQEKAEWK